MNPTITVFINPTCEPCNRLKSWLSKKQIPYLEKDIINDVSAAREFRAEDGEYTPTTFIEVGGEKYKVIGANFEKIERILNVSV